MMKILALLIVVVGCAVASDEIWMQLWSAQMQNAIEMEMNGKDSENIPALAGSLGETELVDLVKKADLVEALSGPGPFTVFGPTNDAFKKVPKVFLEMLLKNNTLLKEVLTYHVLSAKVLSGQLEDNMLVNTLQGKQIRINFYKDKSVITASGRRVTKPDQIASNGVIHEVGGVLLPPAGTITAVVSKCPDFSTLLAAVKAAGLGDTLNGRGPFTIFAPTNKAFSNITPKCLEKILANKALLTDILTYHVISGVAYSAGLSDGDSVPTLFKGENVKISISKCGSVKVNDAKVVYPDMTVTNGAFHTIDTVLIPPNITCDDVKMTPKDTDDQIARWLNKNL